MSSVLVIQNDVKEGAGQLGSILDARGYRQNILHGWEADYSSIRASDFTGLVILGGAQGVYETDTCPYLLDEIKLIQSFIDVGVPVIGLCLGAQLLAKALDGEVRKNEIKELGWHDICLSAEGQRDAIMSAHSETAPAFHFHGDFFTTPPGCVNLASSAITQCQLFRYKENVYGFQYHVEVDLPLLEIMCLNNTDYMAANGSDAQAVVEQSRSLIDAYMQRCAVVLNAWADLLESPA